MARDEDRDRVAPVGGTRRPRRARPPGARRQLRVRDRRPRLHLQQRVPDRALEGRAARGERDVEREALAGEVLGELRSQHPEPSAAMARAAPQQRGQEAAVVLLSEEWSERRVDGG
jgi:hypothetical protein